MSPKSPVPSPHSAYLRALQTIADQSKNELAALMPHMPERGRILEEVIRGVLQRTLPKRFSLGTGVIISASGQVSAQTDIVIYDNFFNSPLLSEFGAGVYPVEIVFATIEVKSELTKTRLTKSLSAIRTLREVGSKKHYIVPQFGARTITVPPRSYIVAFSQTGLGRTYHEFCGNLKSQLDSADDFVHGVAVLRNDWFVKRIAFRKPTELSGGSDNALLRLYSAILKGQNNFAVYPMDLDKYLA